MALRVERQQDQLFVNLVWRPHLIANGELRQNGLLLVERRGRIVRPLHIRAQVTGKLNRVAARGKRDRAAVGGLAGNFNGGAQHLRVGHLRRHRALPDQLVNLQLVALEDLLERRRRLLEMRRADRFVRFLRVAHLRLILPLVVEPGAVQFLHRFTGLGQRLRAERRRVGAVIRNQSLRDRRRQGPCPGTAAARSAWSARTKSPACDWLPVAAWRW